MTLVKKQSLSFISDFKVFYLSFIGNPSVWDTTAGSDEHDVSQKSTANSGTRSGTSGHSIKK